MLDLQRVLLLVRAAVSVGVGVLMRAVSGRERAIPVPVRIREAIETLGLTYVKLGQFLAMRVDILSPALCEELGKLFDSVAPVPSAAIIAVVESELGAPIGRLFANFNPEPIAAASIAQVHEARTHAGERVAVKVQRPGAERVFAADMRNMRRLARLVDWLPINDVVSVSEVVSEFEGWTSKEFDFVLEASRAEDLRANARPYEVIAGVVWSMTTRRVLTMEFVDGVSIARLASLRRSGGAAAIRQILPAYDAPLAMRRLTEACLHHMFVDGVFNADVHPGNVFVRADNTVAILDFGIVGELTPRRRALLAKFYESLATGRVDDCFRAFMQLWVVTPDSDVRGFERAVKPILAAFYRDATDPESTVERMHWGNFSNETLQAARQNRMRSSLELVLFFRAMGALHTGLILLDVDFIAEMRRFLARHARTTMEKRITDALTPRAIGTRAELAIESGVTLSRLARRAPARALRVRAGRRVVRAHEGAVAVAVTAVAFATTTAALATSGVVVIVAAGAGALAVGVMLTGLVRAGRSTAALERA